MKNINKYISVSIVGDKEIQELNKKHLGRDYTTDVLSFQVKEILEDGTEYLGDIVVNRDQAKRQMAEYKNDVEHEISELVAHGILHLLDVHHPHDDEESTHGVQRPTKEKK